MAAAQVRSEQGQDGRPILERPWAWVQGLQGLDRLWGWGWGGVQSPSLPPLHCPHCEATRAVLAAPMFVHWAQVQQVPRPSWKQRAVPSGSMLATNGGTASTAQTPDLSSSMLYAGAKPAESWAGGSQSWGPPVRTDRGGTMWPLPLLDHRSQVTGPHLLCRCVPQ